MIKVIMEIKDVYSLFEQKEEAILQANKIKKQFEDTLKQYIEQYFNGNIPDNIPISKNQFITVMSNSFKLHKGESGNIYWTVTGNVRTVKDGDSTYGHSQKTLYQAQYEAMPLALKNLTLTEAKQNSLPLFPIVSQHYNGRSFSNYAYLLAQDDSLGLMLLWRKAGTGYIDRMSGSTSTPSALQLLVQSKIDMRKDDIMEAINKKVELGKAKDMALRAHRLGYTEIVEGGKLTKDVILQNAEVINGIFGADTVNNIVTIMESKTKKAKDLKEDQVKEEQLAINVKPSKKMK